MDNRKSTIENQHVLAIETSGRQGSVALAQGAQLLGQVEFSGPMRHSAEIFPAITTLLKQFGKKAADIEQVYISVGPGSFTGLRIAVTIAKTYALANPAPIAGNQKSDPQKKFGLMRQDNWCGTKIVAVDTLDCIADNVNSQDISEKQLGVILDAKRGQFFIAVYENTPAGWEKILPDSLMTADEFLNRFADKPIALIGEGLVFYKDKFNNPSVRILDEKYWNPSASGVYRLGLQKARRGEFSDPLTLIPNYIRGPDVTIKQI